MNKTLFKGSFFEITKMPTSECEVVFLGRSNVGKSSTINAVLQTKTSMVSKTPGKTVAINFFSTPNHLSFVVDVPGYGYASVNKTLRSKWADMLPDYLMNRKSLSMSYIIIDSRIGLTTIDINVIDILATAKVPFSIICNKMDKIKLKEQTLFRDKIVSDISNQKEQAENIYYISAKKTTILDITKLRKDIRRILKY